MWQYSNIILLSLSCETFLCCAVLCRNSTVTHEGFFVYTSFLSRIRVNIGLPEWVSPHLNIELTYCTKLKKLILAEQDEDVIFIDKGMIFLKTDDSLKLLNSTLINFLKSIILHQNMIDQALLIFGVDAKVEDKIPAFLGEYFITMFNCFDDSSPDGWIKLAEL